MKFITLIIISTLLFSGCTLPFTGQKNAGLNIESNPPSNVYVDDQHVGNTPLTNDKIKPGDHTVKLISLTDPTQTHEVKINLKQDIIMVINRAFAATPQESMGYILDLEKLKAKDKSEITVITTPANAIVRLDDQPRVLPPCLMLASVPDSIKLPSMRRDTSLWKLSPMFNLDIV